MQILIFVLEYKLLDLRITMFLGLSFVFLCLIKSFWAWIWEVKDSLGWGFIFKGYSLSCAEEYSFLTKSEILRKLASSDNGLEATPVPIPNTKVKL